MSTPESIRATRTVPENLPADLGDFTGALHGAAFISSEGKAYRLFADDERPALGGAFQFGPPPIENWDDLLPGQQESPPMRIRFPAPAPVAETVLPKISTSPPTLPIDEAIRRIRAVEGTVGRRMEEPAAQLFDSMAQSVTDKSKRALSIGQTAKQSSTVKIRETADGVPERNRPSIFRPSVEFVESPLRIIPISSGRSKDEITVPPSSRYSGTTPAEDRSWMPPEETASPLTEPSAEHWEVESYDTVFVSGPPEPSVSVPSISLTRLVAPTPRRRRRGFEPRRLPLRIRQAEIVEMPEEAKPQRVPFHWPDVVESLKERASQQFGALADGLVAQWERGHRRICFHSFVPAEGCSTALLCAVRELTERGFRVLLVDANARHPELAELLGVEMTSGVAERVTLLDEGLEFLSWGVAEADGVEMDQSAYVGWLPGQYDFILMDGGSLTEGAPEEKTIFWQNTRTDGVLLVINTKNHRPVNLEAVNRRLQQHGVELLGVSENRA